MWAAMYFPILKYHICNTAIVSDVANTPQREIGDYFEYQISEINPNMRLVFI